MALLYGTIYTTLLHVDIIILQIFAKQITQSICFLLYKIFEKCVAQSVCLFNSVSKILKYVGQSVCIFVCMFVSVFYSTILELEFLELEFFPMTFSLLRIEKAQISTKSIAFSP